MISVFWRMLVVITCILFATDREKSPQNRFVQCFSHEKHWRWHLRFAENLDFTVKSVKLVLRGTDMYSRDTPKTVGASFCHSATRSFARYNKRSWGNPSSFQGLSSLLAPCLHNFPFAQYLYLFAPNVRESKTVLDSGFYFVDSRFLVLDFSLCRWDLDSGFQSLVWFPIPYGVFQIPKPRIPDSTRKISWTLESGFPYMGKTYHHIKTSK